MPRVIDENINRAQGGNGVGEAPPERFMVGNVAYLGMDDGRIAVLRQLPTRTIEGL